MILLDRSEVGVLGNGEFWPRMGFLRKDRGGRGCWVWKDDVGEAGDEALDVGWEEASRVVCRAFALVATTAIVY